MFSKVAINSFLNGLILMIAMLMCGCSNQKTIFTEPNVNLTKFMGDWYVIANIPTFIEKNAYNAIESYRLNEDGTIATTFKFNAGSFNGPQKEYHPKGYVYDKDSNAYWGMQFIWPFKGEYRIVYVDSDYNYTIIGRTKRDYIWIMARTSKIEEVQYQKMIKIAQDQGYDTSKILLVPQK